MTIRLEDASSAVQCALKTLAREHLQLMLSHGSETPIPKELFHYTDAEALKGIVSTNCVWASNVRFLNDLSEREYGSELIQAVLNEATEITPGESNAAQFLKEASEWTVVALGTLWSCYVFSMSEVRDQLSQWRSYSAAGMGYCIGFDTSALRTLICQHANPTFLMKISYNRDHQQRTIQELKRKYCTSLNTIKSITRDELALFQGYFMHHLQTLLAWFKHEAFEEEREWRLICNVNYMEETTDIDFRISNRQLVPFLRFRPHDQQLIPIRSVVLGAGVLSSERPVRLMLWKHKHNDFEIVGSKIPLRCC